MWSFLLDFGSLLFGEAKPLTVARSATPYAVCL